MKKRIRKETISVRMPSTMIDTLEKEVDAELYNDRSDAIISRINDSYRLGELMEIAKDPELQNEMNDKIKSMVGAMSIEKTLETMTIKERNQLIFFAQNLNEKTLKQVTFQ